MPESGTGTFFADAVRPLFSPSGSRSPAPFAVLITVSGLYQFPRAHHTQAAIGRLDLDEEGADVRDGADAYALAHVVAYLEFHVASLRHGYPRSKSSRDMSDLRRAISV